MGDKKNMKDRMMFWKKVKESVSPAEAVSRLRNLQDMLEKKSDWLESNIEKETKIAVDNRTKNKRAALQALRRRKRWQKQLTTIDGTMSTVEMNLKALTEASMTTEVVRCLEVSKQALRSANNNLSADAVADLKGELEDLLEDTNEIHNLLAQPMGCDFDEDELLAELEEIEQEELTDQLCDTHLNLPPVPSHSPQTAQEKQKKKREEDDEEAELQKLAEWM